MLVQSAHSAQIPKKKSPTIRQQTSHLAPTSRTAHLSVCTPRRLGWHINRGMTACSRTSDSTALSKTQPKHKCPATPACHSYPPQLVKSASTYVNTNTDMYACICAYTMYTDSSTHMLSYSIYIYDIDTRVGSLYSCTAMQIGIYRNRA